MRIQTVQRDGRGEPSVSRQERSGEQVLSIGRHLLLAREAITRRAYFWGVTLQSGDTQLSIISLCAHCRAVWLATVVDRAVELTTSAAPAKAPRSQNNRTEWQAWRHCQLRHLHCSVGLGRSRCRIPARS